MSAKNETIIELKKVVKRYGLGDAETFALDELSLEIKQGEFVIIMGPSGCGKTTLLNVIGLLDSVTLGSYELGGKRVDKLSKNKKARLRAKEIGFIFQNFNLIPSLTVLENVALPLLYANVGELKRSKAASEVLKTFKLQEREYYLPTQLSGGQQQRVAIARALVSNPAIILADEPTGNLDSRSSHIVMEELRALHSEGNTIIMVTHNPNLATYATRVINMLDGRIDTDIKTVSDANLPRPITPQPIFNPQPPAPKPAPAPPPPKPKKSPVEAPIPTPPAEKTADAPNSPLNKAPAPQDQQPAKLKLNNPLNKINLESSLARFKKRRKNPFSTSRHRPHNRKRRRK